MLTQDLELPTHAGAAAVFSLASDMSVKPSVTIPTKPPRGGNASLKPPRSPTGGVALSSASSLGMELQHSPVGAAPPPFLLGGSELGDMSPISLDPPADAEFDELLKTRKRPFVIGCTGGTASGKTTVCSKVRPCSTILSWGYDHLILLHDQHHCSAADRGSPREPQSEHHLDGLLLQGGAWQIRVLALLSLTLRRHLAVPVSGTNRGSQQWHIQFRSSVSVRLRLNVRGAEPNP